MVKAWLMDNCLENQFLEHQRSPPVPVTIEELKSKTGVLYCKIDPDLEKEKLETLKIDRGYTYEDIIELDPEKLPNFDQAMKKFYEEHIHTDEEIRYILEGSGYFDVRFPNEDWVRISLEKGDLIVLPAGIYHRFTLDSKKYVKAMRLFIGEPVWTPYYRPSDEMEVRQNYVKYFRERI
ncbi:1,2-dihydroxy-3-keto-5-methylthiopentene dioxygenase [Armadillidium nasatum]|uniref:Acireductone dioxygenase n=1 Tax=Armadillidium nasatum TaxID=96803 RepID=A0A5N5TGZ6_9CRUS|nr:1,2-dihydroxy-3-keto-5-methylthiopentene dioxygenase [Armadillidium nasatum]